MTILLQYLSLIGISLLALAILLCADRLQYGTWTYTPTEP